MIKHIFTIERLAKELQSLVGATIAECYTQEKDSADLLFNHGSHFSCLHFSAEGNKAALFLRGQFNRARKNSLDILPELLDETVQSVSAVSGERIIKIELIHTNLYAVLFGGSQSNLIVTTKDSRIIEALESNNSPIGSRFKIKLPYNLDPSAFEEDASLETVLSKSSLHLGKYYAEELCLRLGFELKSLWIDIAENDKARIIEAAKDIRNECFDSKEFYFLKNNSGEKFLSLIKLQAYPVIDRTFDSLSEAIQKLFIGSIIAGEFDPAKRDLLKMVNSFVHKLERNVSDMSKLDEARARASEYRLLAEILMAAPDVKKKNIESIVMNDWSGNELTIKLDPRKNLIENGARYFDKSRRTLEDIKMREKRLPAMIEKLSKAKEMLVEINACERIKELDKIKERWQQNTGKKMQGEDIKPADKFRKFELSEGFVIYVGRNSANNDELTMKFAKPHDMWFHARGSSGSHAVVPLAKEQKLPKNILKEAAEIVAYYSGARKAKYVPVCYTRKMNVKKFKGAAQGAVTISREDVVMVEPKLPEGNE